MQTGRRVVVCGVISVTSAAAFRLTRRPFTDTPGGYCAEPSICDAGNRFANSFIAIEEFMRWLALYAGATVLVALAVALLLRPIADNWVARACQFLGAQWAVVLAVAAGALAWSIGTDQEEASFQFVMRSALFAAPVLAVWFATRPPRPAAP